MSESEILARIEEKCGEHDIPMDGDEPDYGDIASKIGDLAEVTERISDLCEKHDISSRYPFDWEGSLVDIGEALEKSAEATKRLKQQCDRYNIPMDGDEPDYLEIYDRDQDWKDFKCQMVGMSEVHSIPLLDNGSSPVAHEIEKVVGFRTAMLDALMLLGLPSWSKMDIHEIADEIEKGAKAVYELAEMKKKLKADHAREVNEMMHDPKWHNTEVKRLREKEAEYLTIIDQLTAKMEKKPQKRKREEEEKESAPPEKKQKKEEETTPPQKMMTSCDEENLEEHEKMHDKLDELIQKYTNKDVASEFENGWHAWEEKMAAIENQLKLYNTLKAQAACANDYGHCPCERSLLVPLLVTATCHKCKTEYASCCDDTIEIRRHKYCDTKECRPVFDCDRCGDTGITHDGIGAACQAIDRACTSCSYEGCNADDCSKDDMCDKCKALKCTRCQDVGSLRGQFNIDMGPCGDCDPDGAEEFMTNRLKPGKF